MVSSALAEKINQQRRQLKQKKEKYEDSCKKYKTEFEEEYEEFYGRYQELSNWGYEMYEMHDTKLLNLIDYNRDSMGAVEEACANLLMTIDAELSSYICDYQEKDDDLQRELNQLEWI